MRRTARLRLPGAVPDRAPATVLASFACPSNAACDDAARFVHLGVVSVAVGLFLVATQVPGADGLCARRERTGLSDAPGRHVADRSRGERNSRPARLTPGSDRPRGRRGKRAATGDRCSRRHGRDSRRAGGGLGRVDQGDDIRGSKASTALGLGADVHWVDHSHVGNVETLVLHNSVRWIISQQLFWNHSITRVLTLPGAPDADAFQNDRVRIDSHGVLRNAGATVTRPLLIEGVCGERAARERRAPDTAGDNLALASSGGRALRLADRRPLLRRLARLAVDGDGVAEGGRAANRCSLPAFQPACGNAGGGDARSHCSGLRRQRDADSGTSPAGRDPAHGEGPLDSARAGKTAVPDRAAPALGKGRQTYLF